MSSTRLSNRLCEALVLTKSLGHPKSVYEYEHHAHIWFSETQRVSFYYHTNDTIHEIHTVGCELDHEKVTHKFQPI